MKCSAEFELTRPVNACLLVVPARREPELHSSPTDRKLVREEVARIEVVAVGSDDVDLVRGVLPMNQPIRPTPTPSGSNEHDIAVSIRPLALDADQSRPQVKDEVISLVPERAQDSYAGFHGLEDDRLLGHDSLLIRRQHPHMVAVESDGLLPVL